MKANKIVLIINIFLLIGVILEFTYCINRDIINKPAKPGPVSVEYFKQGDTLLPDYACPDTLIVIDAAGLNKAIAPIEQGFEDATDGNIAAVMYQYCIIKQ